MSISPFRNQSSGLYRQSLFLALDYRGMLFVDHDRQELIKTMGDELQGDIEEHFLHFRYPPSDFTLIVDWSKARAEKQDQQLRLNRVMALLDSWSFRDGNGSPTPVTSERLKALDPVVLWHISCGMELWLRRIAGAPGLSSEVAAAALQKIVSRR